MATVWEEFGIAVAKARAARKWTLQQLAHAAFGNDERKGYVSQIEKGKTRLQARTVQKLADALKLPGSVTDPVFRADLPAADEADKVDRDAERLIRLVERDASAPSTAEALLITLAYEFAQGPHLNMQTAYNGLRAALQAAADFKARGEMPQNSDDQLQAVMREVSRLNDLGQRDEAAGALDEALQRADAARDAIVTLQLDQDRIRDVPDAAASRLIARSKASAPPGGVWAATRDLIEEWREKGETQGLAFDLQVARHLAKQNLARARGAQQSVSLDDLANCQLRLG